MNAVKLRSIRNYLSIAGNYRNVCAGIDYKSHCTRSNSNESTLSKDEYKPRRAMLYVPGNDERKIRKTETVDVDCVVLDCEDGVATNQKNEARTTIRRLFNELNFRKTEYAIRVNSVDSGLAEDDIRTVFDSPKKPATLMIPKVENTKHIDWISEKLMKYSGFRSDHNRINLVIFVESARAMLDLDQICLHCKNKHHDGPFNLEGIVFGSDDYCADIGLQMGFTGKQVIHPSQVPIVQAAFAPSPEKIQWAMELIRAYENHQTSGKGAFNFQGSMIDKPLLLQAQHIVNLSLSYSKDGNKKA